MPLLHQWCPLRLNCSALVSLSFSLCASDPNAWKMLSQLRWPNFFKAYFTNFSRKHLSEPKCCQTASLRGPWSQHNDHTSGTHSFIIVHAHTKCWDLLSSFSSHLIASSSSCSQLLDSVFVPLVYLLHRFISRASRVDTSMLIMKASSCTGEFGYMCTHNRPRVVLYIYIYDLKS